MTRRCGPLICNRTSPGRVYLNLALVFVLGPGTRSIYIAITLVGWVSYARIIRGEILVAKRQEYVLAAQAAGFRDLRIIVRHLLPNVITQAIVFAMSDIVLDILAIVTLGYLGLGIQPPIPDWGGMIADGQSFLTTKWELSTIPGVAVILTALGATTATQVVVLASDALSGHVSGQLVTVAGGMEGRVIHDDE